MRQYKVKVLKPGYSQWIKPDKLRASGTITLVYGNINIIVDTGGPCDKLALLDVLAGEGLTPDDIMYVVCTHGHSDHIGNNNLFPEAIFIVSHDISQGDCYTLHDFNREPYFIDNDVEVIATPGHTKQDVSVIVRSNRGTDAIVGDLFECESDLEQEDIWKNMSEFPEEQEANRKMILEIAEFIIPGHGSEFLTEKYKP